MARVNIVGPAEVTGTRLLMQLTAVGPGEPLATVSALEQASLSSLHVERVAADTTIPEIKEKYNCRTFLEYNFRSKG